MRRTHWPFFCVHALKKLAPMPVGTFYFRQQQERSPFWQPFTVAVVKYWSPSRLRCRVYITVHFGGSEWLVVRCEMIYTREIPLLAPVTYVFAAARTCIGDKWMLATLPLVAGENFDAAVISIQQPHLASEMQCAAWRQFTVYTIL